MLNKDILKMTGFFGKGLLTDQLPDIAQGVFIELIKSISFDQICDMINRKENLWDRLKENYRQQIIKLAPTLQWDWLTVHWIIDTLKTDRPELASLFLGWAKGRNWIERQLEDIKKQAGITVT